MPLPNLPNTFSILEVVLRLRDSAHVFNRVVGGGLEFEAKNVESFMGDKHLPYAFVVPIDVVGKKINREECYQERVAVVGIVVCVDGKEHRTDASGTNPVGVAHSFAPVIAAIEDSLLTWKPTGFTPDGPPEMERLRPLGATQSRAYQMLEYAIPFRHYHLGYGGRMLNEIEEFNKQYPNYAATLIESLLVRYKAKGEFPTIVGQHFFDNVPFPVPSPTAEQIAAFEDRAEEFNIDDRVRNAVEERQYSDALPLVEQSQDGPFEP